MTVGPGCAFKSDVLVRRMFILVPVAPDLETIDLMPDLMTQPTRRELRAAERAREAGLALSSDAPLPETGAVEPDSDPSVDHADEPPALFLDTLPAPVPARSFDDILTGAVAPAAAPVEVINEDEEAVTRVPAVLDEVEQARAWLTEMGDTGEVETSTAEEPDSSAPAPDVDTEPDEDETSAPELAMKPRRRRRPNVLSVVGLLCVAVAAAVSLLPDDGRFSIPAVALGLTATVVGAAFKSSLRWFSITAVALAAAATAWLSYVMFIV